MKRKSATKQDRAPTTPTHPTLETPSQAQLVPASPDQSIPCHGPSNRPKPRPLPSCVFPSVSGPKWVSISLFFGKQNKLMLTLQFTITGDRLDGQNRQTSCKIKNPVKFER